MFCMAALWALQHNSQLFIRIFVLSGGEPFNHEGVTLFTRHGCLPSKIPNKTPSGLGTPSFYPSKILTTFLIRNWGSV